MSENIQELKAELRWHIEHGIAKTIPLDKAEASALLEHVEGLECVLGDRLIELTQQDERIMALEERVTSLRGALRHLHHNAKASGAEMGLALEIAEAALAEQGEKV